MTHLRHVAFAGLILLSSCVGGARPGARQPSSDEPPPALRARNSEFLTAVDKRAPRQLAGFFPRQGEVVYRRTIYSDDGTAVREHRFPAKDIPAALSGPLWPAFTAEVEGQAVGMFAHQLTLRGRDWEYAGSQRFVPGGAEPCSAIYVEWRLENGIWVVSEIADEEFRTDALPPWCC